jgi:hypothetical protein
MQGDTDALFFCEICVDGRDVENLKTRSKVNFFSMYVCIYACVYALMACRTSIHIPRLTSSVCMYICMYVCMCVWHAEPLSSVQVSRKRTKTICFVRHEAGAFPLPTLLVIMCACG